MFSVSLAKFFFHEYEIVCGRFFSLGYLVSNSQVLVLHERFSFLARVMSEMFFQDWKIIQVKMLKFELVIFVTTCFNQFT